MRMPLATQASSSVWLMPSHITGPRALPRLTELHPHDKRGAFPGIGRPIIAFPLADHLESERAIKPHGRRVGLVHFQEARRRTLAIQSPDGLLHQEPAKPAAALGECDGDGEDLGLIGNRPYQRE